MSTMRREKKQAVLQFLNQRGIQTINSNYSRIQKEVLLQLAINKIAKKTERNVKQVFDVLTSEMSQVFRRSSNNSACALDILDIRPIGEVREVSMLYATHDQPVTNSDLDTTTNLADNDQEPDAPTTKEAD